MADATTDGNEFMDLGTLEPVEVSVKLGGQAFLLREPTAADAAAYKNAAMSGAKLDDGKMVGIGRPADAEAVLVGRCLHRPGKDGRWEPVGEVFAKTLPARVAARLYEKARQIGGLDEKADGGAPGKDGQQPTGSTST